MFAINLLTSFSRQKNVTVENPKTVDCWGYRVLSSCKVLTQTNKNCKTSLEETTFCLQLSRRVVEGLYNTHHYSKS